MSPLTPTLVLLIATAAMASTSREWAKYKLKHEKLYSVEDDADRMKIWTKNVAMVEKHNSEKHNYTMAINKFSDWTHEEFNNLLGYRPRGEKSIGKTFEMRIEILDENNYEEFNEIKARLNDTEEELNSMKEKHRIDIEDTKIKFSEDLNKMKSQILADITSKSPNPVTEYFGACVDSWCRQSGTSDQFTKCESVRDGGLTCVNPEVRYGSTEGGIPGKDSSNNYDAWCQQILGFGTNSRVTYGARDCAAPKGRLFWCTGGDELGAKWCDNSDGYWKDATLDHHYRCDTDGITSLTCSK